MKKTILYIFLFCPFIIFSQSEKIEIPKLVIKIVLGETVELNNATITFNKVIEDSRCPKDVTCVWAGEVKVEVLLKTDGENSQRKELVLKRQNVTLYETKDYKLQIIKITPNSISTVKKEDMEYALFIYESEK